MTFTIDHSLLFAQESSVLSGVQKMADKVRNDIDMVIDTKPSLWRKGEIAENLVIYGTLGHSPLLEEIERQGRTDYSSIRGKWEVYSFQLIDNPMEGVSRALVIAGSDKRGTIYGLFHLSEVIGVSPLTHWNHMQPCKKKKVELSTEDCLISKEPSVRYRGFFINNEWPAFGNWAEKHFGGVNSSCYEPIFELLLRLKGNYLWPAMWASDFSLDGPGLANAELADEYGIVMSTSHHEPCMRSGWEYKKVRGADSPYGDAWDYRTNPQGLQNFWRDGLLRNKKFENVITMGMRGENDSILMANASLEENVQVLRDILHTQNKLIKETISPDLTAVPRQFVIFTEIEEFFYGNEETKGLQGDAELEDVILILSDNNHGSTRTLPTEAMRSHSGGYGMYYHMDMHGGAHSYQWIGSTYLPRVWEQMTTAYEYGVQELWVVNIGDIATQEYGLSYFLDLAYDIERWGGNDAAITDVYRRRFIEQNFHHIFAKEDMTCIEEIFERYTYLLHLRKHETMNEQVYHPVHFGEAEYILSLCKSITDDCDRLRAKCPAAHLTSFVSLIYYPAVGTANLMKMWILTGRNQLYARQNRREANILAEAISDCIQRDYDLVKEYHRIGDAVFDGFGLSEHIGFTNWNEEDNKYPLRTYMHPSNHPRMIVSRTADTEYMTGYEWTNRPQEWKDFLRPDVEELDFCIACGSREAITYRIESECEWMSFSSLTGTTEATDTITLSICRDHLTEETKGVFCVSLNDEIKTEITVLAGPKAEMHPTQNAFWEYDGYIAMPASHYQDSAESGDGYFLTIQPYGRYGSAIRTMPVTKDFSYEKERPWVRYSFVARQTGKYRLRFYLSATTPVTFKPEQCIGFSINDGEIHRENTVWEEDRPFFGSPQWEREAYDGIKMYETEVFCQEGVNILTYYGMSPAMILEKIILYPVEQPLPESYLGPGASYFK